MKKQLRSRFLAMMIPLTLLFVFVAQSAYGANPTKKLLTLNFNKTPLATALKAVEKESGCKVLFTYDEVQSYHVTATVKKEPLTHAMTAVLKGLPFQYKLNGNFVIVSKNAQAAAQPAQKAAGNKVFGVIVDEEGEPLIGITVRIKGTGKGTITNFDGEFTLEDDNRKTPLLFSYIGKEDIEKLPVYGQSMKLVMKDSQVGKKLDEVIVVGYGTMKKRDVTGSISSISSKEIENKMATNVYEALQGSTAGVQVVSGSGQPGESSTIKVRGTLFRNVPLIEVVRDLGRWYNINIEIRDNSLMSYRLHFVASRKASVKEFVDNLNVFNYLSVVQKGNRLIIDKKENK